MGRRLSPAHRTVRGLARARVAGICLAISAVAALTGMAFVPQTASAQTLNDRFNQRLRGDSTQSDRMLVDAEEMRFDRDKDIVEAHGAVQLFYQGRILQADKVIYNRKTKRVFAEGRVKLTETDGTVSYGTRFELTDDLRDGFVESLQTDSADKTHFTAPRAERAGGDSTTFFNGTYTACEACKNNPERPPFWRIRAKRIIHNNEERMVYYEDATLELWGMPIAWLPYFSTPDPSVKRKSGFLAPRYVARSSLGVGASAPYFWALAPHYDLTITPTFLTRQGVLGEVEWRHRLVNGAYSIRATGIFQADPGAFKTPPYGAGNKQVRGSLESKGEFAINERWKTGWDITILSDRWFVQDYKLPQQNLSSNYFKEATSTVYLTGKSESAWFDLRGYYFQGLSRSDVQRQQPVVAPVLDYNKRIKLSPQSTGGIGGELQIDFNFTNIARELASFEAIGGRRLDRAYGLHDVCENAMGVPTYNRANCLLRGMAGQYTRATLNVEWRRRFIDPIGQVWTPFVFAHVNGSWLNLDKTGSQTFSNPGCGVPPCFSTINNAYQSVFFGGDQKTFSGQAVPGVGLEYRYPFIARSGDVTHVIEPIAQIIARPNEARNILRVNEDAQSLVFDDTNLFDRTKYSGYDRFEGGVRSNVGIQYTATFQKGGYANLLVGQSFHMAGRNSYATPDASNIGLSSGLDKNQSDLVGRAAFAPNSMFNFVAKTRFDPQSLNMRRLDLAANMNFGRWEASLQYARYAAQPQLGFDKRREGLAAGTKFKVTENVSLNGAVIFDLSRHLYNSTASGTGINSSAPLFSVAGLGLGATYNDECTTLGVQYTSVLQANSVGQAIRNHTVLMTLQLRTVGDTRVRSGFGESAVTDGLGGAILR